MVAPDSGCSQCSSLSLTSGVCKTTLFTLVLVLVVTGNMLGGWEGGGCVILIGFPSIFSASPAFKAKSSGLAKFRPTYQ